jgi:hypothetical protein
MSIYTTLDGDSETTLLIYRPSLVHMLEITQLDIDMSVLEYEPDGQSHFKTSAVITPTSRSNSAGANSIDFQRPVEIPFHLSSFNLKPSISPYILKVTLINPSNSSFRVTKQAKLFYLPVPSPESSMVRIDRLTRELFHAVGSKEWEWKTVFLTGHYTVRVSLLQTSLAHNCILHIGLGWVSY